MMSVDEATKQHKKDVALVISYIERDHAKAWDYLSPVIRRAICDAAILDLAIAKDQPMSSDRLNDIRFDVRTAFGLD
jgi:hypothetical protein